jgi:hypothetical protein
LRDCYYGVVSDQELKGFHGCTFEMRQVVSSDFFQKEKTIGRIVAGDLILYYEETMAFNHLV